MNVEIKDVVRENELNQIRELFQEYQRGLGIDLCFQSFEQELQALPGVYSPPLGRLYILYVDNRPAG